MRRRLDLAGAIVARPKVVVLDEPTTGLDPRGRLDTWDVVSSLVADGTTVLLTTQYLEEADRLADHIAVINHGRVIAEGTATELKQSAGTERIDVVMRDAADLTAAAGVLERAAGRVPGRNRTRRTCASPSPPPKATGCWSGSCPNWTPAPCRWTRPRCAAPPWTTCSCDSPATPPRRPRTRNSGSPGSGESRGARMSAITAAARDSSVIARRNLINVLRTPGALVTGIVQPVMFVLLLGFVFGGTLGGDQYRSYLIGGILAQTLTFNASFTAVYLAKDLQLGLIDRFRSLPMSRVAVILGRTSSDLSTSVLSVAVTLLCGLAIGWRITTGPASALGRAGPAAAVCLCCLLDRSGHRPDGQER